MHITHTDIWKFSIPMHPFTIATGTMNYAQNIFIRIHVDAGFYGVGECSAFPAIVGETQATCFELAKDFASLWKGKDAMSLGDRIEELHLYTAFNTTIKSAFDMALHDLVSKQSNMPLYHYLGGRKRMMETDLTIGIDSPDAMAKKAIQFKNSGVNIIKIKLGKTCKEDLERVKLIRGAVGDDIILRIDANQGWDFGSAIFCLQKMEPYNIQFCEQPMRYWNDPMMPELRKLSPIKIMADESVFDHHDAKRLIKTEACDYINIKLAKSGGILEATKINQVCQDHHIPCMMGGMLESRIALTAFAHFALAHDNIIFYDMDTSLIGHTMDPVSGGVRFKGYFLEIPESPGIGADADNEFLQTLQKITI